ncbi:GrpB family protein [Arthrobacter sp. ISL-69]|uniref:GrpB family protein n=1 Tax=Arthrobacter sp. ISL-69 TaxID=2819113 RepID=UPI001BE8B26F|nr:GrpB family protein [Arthrobacter sp. ISL-69]MBT2537481.1 GrpB family protein [Arthrobacter sp. ISL-69]
MAYRQSEPGSLQEHRTSWAVDYDEIRELVERTITDQVLQIRHVGSTAVADLLAKPVIDIDLIIPAVAVEAVYMPRLEAIGFRLIFRDDMAGDPHRQLTFSRPNINLHVWSPNAVEPLRHELFARWLRSSSDDRRLYAAAKQAAARTEGAQRYNDIKSATVYEIYERAFTGDPAHEHDPQPRPGGSR